MTTIEWARNADGTPGKSWNPVTGCSPVSKGCQHCYAQRMARRLAGRAGYPEYPNHFRVTLHPERLDEPLRWRKPSRVFVVSMGDLFHADVPFEFIGQVFARMIAAEQHTFVLLTKRPERMLEFSQWFTKKTTLHFLAFRHIRFGITCGNQRAADERIPLLLQTPAAVRWVSYEPALGPINFALTDDVCRGLLDVLAEVESLRTELAVARQTGNDACDILLERHAEEEQALRAEVEDLRASLALVCQIGEAALDVHAEEEQRLRAAMPAPELLEQAAWLPFADNAEFTEIAHELLTAAARIREAQEARP